MMRRTPSGMTLVETIIAMVILISVILPLLYFGTKAAYNTGIEEMQEAYTLLNGECSIIYSKHLLPKNNKKIAVGGRIYTMICETKRDSSLVYWTLTIKAGPREIGPIKGIAFIPEEDRYAIQ